MKDNFSRQSDLTKYRPDYPAELFEHILRFVKEKNSHWDCGTGNGQSAVPFANASQKYTPPISAGSKLDHAGKTSGLNMCWNRLSKQASITVDLITVGTGDPLV